MELIWFLSPFLPFVFIPVSFLLIFSSLSPAIIFRRHPYPPFSPAPPVFPIITWHLIDRFRAILLPHSARSKDKVRHWAPSLQLMWCVHLANHSNAFSPLPTSLPQSASLPRSLPWGSTSFASLRASELARSVLAGVTARIRQLSLVMNCIIMSLICCSMSTGWSPTGTLVIPGRSMRVRFSTAQSEECKIRGMSNATVTFC